MKPAATFTLAFFFIFAGATSCLAQSDTPPARRPADAPAPPLVLVTVGQDKHFRGNLISINMDSLVMEVEGASQKISLSGVSRIIFIRDWGHAADTANESGPSPAPGHADDSAAAGGARGRSAPSPAGAPTAEHQAAVKSAAAGGDWFVILGSFPKAGRLEADARLRHLRASGYDARTINTDDYPRLRAGLWAVVLGPYTRGEAERAAGELRAKAMADAYTKRGR